MPLQLAGDRRWHVRWRGLRARDEVRAQSRAPGVLLCGGLGGVMESGRPRSPPGSAASPSASCPPTRHRANPHIQIAIATNMGHARSVVLAHSADAFIAVAGEYGTLSEIAIALKLGKRVVGLNTRTSPA
ncbi:MAG: TIGR00725 family protein [bacterium]